MHEQELDALVVRAPDNVLYLTNFWGMKGYDAVVFPRDGEPVLICLEASEAGRGAWPGRRTRFFAATTSRSPSARPAALDLARQIAADYDRVGIELSLGTQAADRMVGEPTTFPKAWFDAFPDAADATPLLAAGARDQDRAGDRAHAARERDRGAAMEHVRRLQPG